jgi:hypothetical protein
MLCFHSEMDFAFELREWKLLGELGVALSLFFQHQGLWSEGMQRLRQAEGPLRKLQNNVLFTTMKEGWIELFNGRNLANWRLRHPDREHGPVMLRNICLREW